ncbi:MULTISPECIES: MerR family transcriptional regulator [Amycolatopsis]|uniref:MerR family transcriptional regulator n=1 Tax=Amycolatopsis dendrobii TaxID=2760662 RepID=A0A7W3VVQ7_9PSEU|nr:MULTISPECIES: MerR family transcriptional regulator [Amycolatopsis]MBB1154101.1 MerR family transcriptional regulator [Amycolatopsis dendrobii]UKD51520.1 MerR family transcriptional regulator [Amycolatopsis sp. FU40]
MRIGELAQRTGTTTRALRFYEAQGLLPAARAANGYREYDEDHLRLVEEIQTLRTVGFSLDDTRPFVDCLRTGHDAGDACPASVEVYRRKLEEVEACMRDLAAVRSALLDKLAAAATRPADPCTAESEEPR